MSDDQVHKRSLDRSFQIAKISGTRRHDELMMDLLPTDNKLSWVSFSSMRSVIFLHRGHVWLPAGPAGQFEKFTRGNFF
jgi:hypothetical protein